MTDEPGITTDDLPEIYRDGYLHAIESARALYHPVADWHGFREYLWNALTQVFGLEAIESRDTDIQVQRQHGP